MAQKRTKKDVETSSKEADDDKEEAGVGKRRSR